MKNTLFPLLMAGVLVADVAPGGCGKSRERPVPPPEDRPSSETTPAPAPTDKIPAPPAP